MSWSTLGRHASMRYAKSASVFDDRAYVGCDDIRRIGKCRKSVRLKQKVRPQTVTYEKYLRNLG